MSNKKGKPNGDEKEPAASTALAKVTTGVMAVPAFMKVGDTRGKEHIDTKTLRPPRLTLAQPQSPQLDSNDPQYIDGLKQGDAFNDLTGQIYGKGALDFLIVKIDTPRHVEFDKERKVVDANVPADDPRTEWTEDAAGNRVKPVATMFRDFVLLKLPEKEPLAYSFKSSGIKTAIRLTSIVHIQPLPIFAGIYQFIPQQQKNDLGTWYAFAVKQIGVVQEEELFRFAEKLFTNLAETAVDYGVEAPREPGDDSGQENAGGHVPKDI